MDNASLPDDHWDTLGAYLRIMPAFFEFLNKVRCNSPVYQIADSIVQKLIIDVSTNICSLSWRILETPKNPIKVTVKSVLEYIRPLPQVAL